MIRLSKSVVGEEEITAISEVLRKGYLGMGEEVLMFEKELSNFIDRPVICVNSGTAALQLALQGINIKPGDEILVQSLTYVACFQAISALGALPIACEVEQSSFTIDLEDAERRLTSNTKAIMPVHYSGSPGQLDKVYEFARNNKLRVIEDASHAFGTVYNGQLIGKYGDIVCFSFDGIKNITSGEGGAITTDDVTVLEKISDARLLGVYRDSEKRYKNSRSWDFDVIEQGWRYHMSNVMAAIGRTQLKKFERFKELRQQFAKKYFECLYETPNLKLLNIDYSLSVPHIFVVRILNGKRDIIKLKFDEIGIQTGIHYKPNHLLSFYHQPTLPLTEKIYAEILSLPLHPDLSISEVIYICDLLKSFLNE